MEKASAELIAEVVAMMASGRLDKDTTQAIRDKRFVVTDDIITVPDISGVELYARAKEELGLTKVDKRLAAGEFDMTIKGKTFAAMVWQPKCCDWQKQHFLCSKGTESEDARRHFHPHGYRGMSAAFIAWVTARQPIGEYITIPEFGYGRLCPDRFHYAPYYESDGTVHALREARLEYPHWHFPQSFVAFREIT